MNSHRMCACLLNISEARRPQVVERVARAALQVNRHYTGTQNNSLKCVSSVLNIFMDQDYNRSVITIAAPIEHIGVSVQDACKEAFANIDLGNHEGGHPRLGSVDLIPIHPLSDQLTIKQCGKVAKNIAESITKQTPGASVFLFGGADKPEYRGLVARRLAVRWYDGKHGSSYEDIHQDVGSVPTSRYGLTGVGAIPYVMNCNVTIETDDLQLGRQIASEIRASNPKGHGFKGVQSMAFHHDGNIEIACNVEAMEINDQSLINSSDLVQAFGPYYYTSANQIQSRIQKLAAEHNVKTKKEATIIGFDPKQAQVVAFNALSQGIEEFWKTRKNKMM